MMKCLIIDDNPMSRKILESMVSKSSILNLIKSCPSALDAADIMKNQSIDLLFLDVEMPTMTGIDLIKSFNEKKPQVILVTGNSEYALQGYDLDVADFLLKPFENKRFISAVTRAYTNHKNNINEESNEHIIFIKSGIQFIPINLNEIFYIEALSDYISIYTYSQKHIVLSTMKGIENKLPKVDFLRVHNSFIIRIDKITEVKENNIKINSFSIPVSRANKKELINRLKRL